MGDCVIQDNHYGEEDQEIKGIKEHGASPQVSLYSGLKQHFGVHEGVADAGVDKVAAAAEGPVLAVAADDLAGLFVAGVGPDFLEGFLRAVAEGRLLQDVGAAEAAAAVRVDGHIREGHDADFMLGFHCFPVRGAAGAVGQDFVDIADLDGDILFPQGRIVFREFINFGDVFMELQGFSVIVDDHGIDDGGQLQEALLRHEKAVCIQKHFRLRQHLLRIGVAVLDVFIHEGLVVDIEIEIAGVIPVAELGDDFAEKILLHTHEGAGFGIPVRWAEIAGAVAAVDGLDGDEAGLLLSAIISDTVLFKSPTCTGYDKITAERLAEIADVEIQKYGMELLKAGASIGDMTPADIAKNDNKEFQIGDYRILVSQISVMDLEDALKMKAELLKSMNGICSSEKFDMCLLMITDILQESTELLYVGSPKPLIGLAFKKDASGDSIFLPGVMSRKKQIIPPLTEAVQRMPK